MDGWIEPITHLQVVEGIKATVWLFLERIQIDVHIWPLRQQPQQQAS
jgi:hypothetical protein